MIPRILASVVLLWSVLFMPWGLTCVLALAAMIYFPIFWEASMMLLLSDLLYGAREAKFAGAFFISFAAGLIIMVLIEVTKKKIKFY